MKRLMRISTVVAIFAFAAMPSAARALDITFEAMSKSGTHQFYIVCSGRDNFVRSTSGSNAEEAQLKIARQAGDRCWPVWQGLQDG